MLEEKIRKHISDPAFRIDLDSPSRAIISDLHIYWDEDETNKRTKSPYALINYSSSDRLTDKERRMQIAHELGHLALAMLTTEGKNDFIEKVLFLKSPQDTKQRDTIEKITVRFCYQTSEKRRFKGSARKLVE